MSTVSLSRPYLPGRRHPNAESRMSYLRSVAAMLMWDELHPRAGAHERRLAFTAISRHLGLPT